MEKLICTILLVVFAGSCGHKFSLQKRRYSNGFYFASNKANKTNTKNSIKYLQKHPAVARIINEEVQATETAKFDVIKKEAENVAVEHNVPKTIYPSTLKKEEKKSLLIASKQNIQKRLNQNKYKSYDSNSVNFFKSLLAALFIIVGLSLLIIGWELVIIGPSFGMTVGLGTGTIVFGIILFLIGLVLFYAAHNLLQ